MPKAKKVDESRGAYSTGDAPGQHKGTIPGAGQEQFIVDHEGNRVGVILSLRQYQQMREDLHDLAMVAERRDEIPISLDEMKRRLKDAGLV